MQKKKFASCTPIQAMDSDDNCLIIDESIADMEVSSTSETPAPKDTYEIDTHNGNEADSSVASILVPSDDLLTPLNLSTHRDGDGHVKDKPKEKQKDKEKDRHREKRRSKDERRKTSTTSTGEKNRSFSRKSNYIRLTEAMFKERMLNVNLIENYFSNFIKFNT